MTITDVLGRQRETERDYPDGSYNCPFCGSAVTDTFPCSWRPCHVTGLHCGNPWCTANPHMRIETAQEIVAKAEQAGREREQRERDMQLWRERTEATQRADDETWIKARAEAERRGACIRCLLRSPWRDFGNPWNPPDRPNGRARFVKHRGTCSLEARS